MGLDMFAYRVKPSTQPRAAVDPDLPADDREQLAYWRKHPDLHEWMFALADRKGFEGGRNAFNCVPVRVTAEDLDQLERDAGPTGCDLNASAGGFFWGASHYPEDGRDTLEFIAAARAAIEEGDEIYYDSWW